MDAQALLRAANGGCVLVVENVQAYFADERWQGAVRHLQRTGWVCLTGSAGHALQAAEMGAVESSLRYIFVAIRKEVLPEGCTARAAPGQYAAHIEDTSACARAMPQSPEYLCDDAKLVEHGVISGKELTALQRALTDTEQRHVDAACAHAAENEPDLVIDISISDTFGARARRATPSRLPTVLTLC